MFKRVIEYFVPTKTYATAEYERRVRLVASAIFITALFALFYIAMCFITDFPTGAKIMSCSFVGDVLLLFLLKRGVNTIVIANIFGLNCSFRIFGCICFSGGLYSAVFPWLAEPPIVLLLIAGKRSGYFSAALSVLMCLFIGIASTGKNIFPKAYDVSKDDFFFLACYMGLVLIIFFTSVVFNNFRLQALKAVTKQKDELQTALTELKTAQKKLIHSEKMASLGELTAGIAHEIQNPLNFVNNFSEVSKELVEEMRVDLEGGRCEEAISISADLETNLEKIAYHGKRADAIVKGMLQHSRTSTGKKEPTDINALADEYLRLAYHGLKAKNNTFNATIKTQFDESIGKIEVVPQEIGRVLLNLCNNAFYAVNEKKKLLNGTFEPIVEVSTKKVGNRVEVSVKDNGTGIPQKAVDKIYQPFFTTKPTGQGTGLGLSLSYDIIKAHSGEIKVETKEGEGAEFVIELPVR